MSMEDKGRELARCLGYRALSGGVSLSASTSSAFGSADAEYRGDDEDARPATKGNVDLWHLRALALQPGGLLNSSGRKSSWIKLAGVDGLVFQREYRGVNAPQDDEEHCTYDEIRAYLSGEMEVSRWHIQRERKHLRTKSRKPRMSSNASHASHASNDVSSIGSASGSTTPLTANLHSNAGTPRSVTFQGVDEPSVRSASVGAPFSFMAFATKSHGTEASSTTSFASLPSVTVDTAFPTAANKENAKDASPSSNEDTLLAPSPLSLPCSPGGAFFAKEKSLPQDRPPLAQLHVDITPVKSYLQYSQRYQQRHKKKGLKPARAKKDRRAQERKLLVQIATSAFYMLQCQVPGMDLQYYEGLQDLIAVLLLRMESPSATSLVLRQVLESHLWMHCTAREEEGASDDGSFATCISDESESVSSKQKWDALSMSFFPLLQVVDEELHTSLLEMDDGQDFLDDRAFMFGEALQKWTSSWFCCHDALPVEVVSRVVDLFLASHSSMPLYLSMAILCHPMHREKLLALSQKISGEPLDAEAPRPQSPPEDADLATLLEGLFANLTQQLGPGADDEVIADFMERCISRAMSFIKQVPPQELASRTKVYQNGILLPCIKPGELESLAATSPWASRSRAPTDYKMIERVFAGGTLFRFPSFDTGVAEKYQIALDASGFADAYWNKLKRKGVVTCKVLVVGVVLFAVMRLLQPQYHGRMDSVPFRGDNLRPINSPALNEETPALEDPTVFGTSVPDGSTPNSAEDDLEDIIVPMQEAGAEETAAEQLSYAASVQSLLGRDGNGNASLNSDDNPVGTSSTKNEPKPYAPSGEVGVERSRAVAVIKGRALAGFVGLRDGFIALVENDDFFL